MPRSAKLVGFLLVVALASTALPPVQRLLASGMTPILGVAVAVVALYVIYRFVAAHGRAILETALVLGLFGLIALVVAGKDVPMTIAVQDPAPAPVMPVAGGGGVSAPEAPIVTQPPVLAVPPSGGQAIRVRISYYWPPLGGPNCFDFRNGYCHSRMASGEKWEDHIGVAIACPKEIPFGTRINIQGREWTCLDRGGKIVASEGIYWVDMLNPEPLFAFGTVVDAVMVLP